MNRSTVAIVIATTTAAIIAAIWLLAYCTKAQAADLTVPAGTVLCHTADAAVRTDHAGCWRAQGGQRVEIIAALSTASQLRLWSSDGSESLTVWTARAVADDIQRVGQ